MLSISTSPEIRVWDLQITIFKSEEYFWEKKKTLLYTPGLFVCFFPGLILHRGVIRPNYQNVYSDIQVQIIITDNQAMSR